MSNLPLPQRGQPIDLSYIYQMASAFNDLSTQVSTNSNKYVSVDTVNFGKQSGKVSDMRIIGGYTTVSSAATVAKGNTAQFTYNFGVEFYYPPIVVVTPVDNKNTAAGKDVYLVLDSVTTSGISGVAKFNTAGDVSVGINIIAIGIPK